MINEKMLEIFNGFYKKDECREKLLSLYNFKCQGCNSDLLMNSNYHVGHIIPRSQPSFFEELFISLDVDNIINLHPLCSSCNLSVSDNVSSYPILNKIYSSNYRKIKNRNNRNKIINREDDINRDKMISIK